MKKVHPYIRAGILLHYVTIAEIVFLYLVFNGLNKNGFMGGQFVFVKRLLLYPFITMPLFPQLDAYSRYQNYKQLRDLFYSYGYNARFVKPFIRSRCQRDAVLAAADDVGFKKYCRQDFYNYGYRWYHFFPDFIFANPKFLLCKHFWMTTFFTKTYHAKINIRMIKLYKKNNQVQLAA